MLNEFCKRKEQLGSVLRNAEKMEETKRTLIHDYCYRLQLRLGQYSLRSQLLATYNSILRLLTDFPDVLEKFFMLGEPQEKKGHEDSLIGLDEDPQ
jgi:hypothetical protein